MAYSTIRGEEPRLGNMAEQVQVVSAERKLTPVHHSSPLCARLGLLLLLIGLLCSLVPGVQTRPIDFVCSDRVRRDRSSLTDLEEAMDRCNGSDTLPAALQLPCVRIHKTEWDGKTLQQKRAEVAEALRVLRDGVGGARSRAAPPCQAFLLNRLEHRLRNDQLIVRQLHIQEDAAAAGAAAASASPAPTDCPSQPSQSLREVLQRYRDLLRGKLDRLATDLQHSSCPGPGPGPGHRR